MIDLFCVFCLFIKLKIFKCEPFDSTGIKLEYAQKSVPNHFYDSWHLTDVKYPSTEWIH